MLSDFSGIEGGYLRDILDQPRAIEATLAELDAPADLRNFASRLRNPRIETVVLTGMGSSFQVLHPLNLQLIEHGFRSMMIETSELVHYYGRLLEGKCLVVAVSQSGQSGEIIRLLEVNRRRCPIIAVTITVGSPLADQSDATILTHAGKEFSVSCKTYLTALMALQWLGAVFCDANPSRLREELALCALAVQQYLERWKDHTSDFAGELAGIHHLFLVGRGSSLAAVGTGALIIKESDHLPAEGLSGAAFRHGLFEMVGEKSFILVFGGDQRTRDLNLHLFHDIRQHRGRAEFVGEASEFEPGRLPDVPSTIQPMFEILPVQMMTLALAALASREPGRFRFVSKITSVE